MKSILLFRHGKSDWNANYEKDHDRPLSKRGIIAAKTMGIYLSKIQTDIRESIKNFIFSHTSIHKVSKFLYF